MFYIYIIYSQRLQRYYVGLAENVEKRLHQHNARKSLSTRAGIPWELIYTESLQHVRKQRFVKEKLRLAVSSVT